MGKEDGKNYLQAGAGSAGSGTSRGYGVSESLLDMGVSKD